MTVRGGGVPVRSTASNAVPQNGPAASELSLPMRITASWSGSSSPPNRRMWRECSCTTCELPSDVVIPTTTSVPSCSKPSRPSLSLAAQWAASLDRSCARRPHSVCGSGRRNGYQGRTKKLKDEKMDRTLGGHPLDKVRPIEGADTPAWSRTTARVSSRLDDGDLINVWGRLSLRPHPATGRVCTSASKDK